MELGHVSGPPEMVLEEHDLQLGIGGEGGCESRDQDLNMRLSPKIETRQDNAFLGCTNSSLEASEEE